MPITKVFSEASSLFAYIIFFPLAILLDIVKMMAGFSVVLDGL